MEVWCVCLGEGEVGAGRRDARVGGGRSPPFVPHVWESAVARRVEEGRCYSRLHPVNNARGECFMARAGL